MTLYAATILLDSPLVFWRFGELTGTSAVDSSGHGHTGTYNSATLGFAGAIASENNAAAKFSGAVASYMDGGVAINVGSVFTLEAWIFKTAATGGAGAAIMGQGNSSVQDATFFWTIDGGAGAGFTSATNTYRAIASLPDVSLNVWHQAVLTYDGTSLRNFIDTVQTGFTAPGTFTPEVLTNHCIVGKLGDYTGGQAFPGIIDEVAIYGTALSTTRIAAHYKAGQALLQAQPGIRSALIR